MKLEYKFLVGNKNLSLLRNKLLPFLEKDKFIQDDAENEYTVRSIYFDSSRFNFYHEKIEGIKVRKKLRIRGYDQISDSNLIFLEIKNKYESFVGKNRAPVMYHNLGNLLKTKSIESYTLTDNGYSNSINDGKKFFHHILKSDLKPTILVVYEREAYFSKFDYNLRITLDKNLRYFEYPKINGLYKDEDMKIALTDHFVLEVKFNSGYPNWLRDIIQEFDLTRRSISKYTICINSSKKLDPGRKKINTSDSLFTNNSASEEGLF